jgi:hypothetical protein
MRLLSTVVLLAACVTLSAHAQSSASPGIFWKGHSGNFNVEWSGHDLQAFRPADPRSSVLDMRQVAQSDWKQISEGPPGKPITASFNYRVLSLVGPVLSIEEDDYCDCGGAHPTAGKMFRAIDLPGSQAAKAAPEEITSLFPAETVYQALRADSAVKKALPPAAKPESLDALVGALAFQNVDVGECSYYFPKELLSRFAFFDLQGDRVSVRFSLSHASEICRGQMTQIGIELPVPEGLQASFAAAKAGREGLLMANRTAAMKQAVSSIEFSTHAK